MRAEDTYLDQSNSARVLVQGSDADFLADAPTLDDCHYVAGVVPG